MFASTIIFKSGKNSIKFSKQATQNSVHLADAFDSGLKKINIYQRSQRLDEHTEDAIL